MCCDYEIILIIFIILYNIIDVYNRHIKVKDDYKKREEFKIRRKELINYIYKTYGCLNYKIINEKINKLEQLLHLWTFKMPILVFIILVFSYFIFLNIIFLSIICSI